MTDTEGEIARTLARLGHAETELGAVGATIARREIATRLSSSPLSELPTLSVGETADLALGREIGRGGMGVVRLASQRSLGREVAVKTTRGDDPRVVRALVREARIMGALEHPSLVPVHALGIGPDSAPALVMKRIEGVVWRTLLYDEAHPAWGPLLAGHGDRLRAHVDVLAQLCRALAFAHERGIVHRDLKPENVIVGRHGEVVLLDWGVALVLAEREREPPGIVGTPGYLAPEMARGDPAHIDARTDVYLLGATLYEVLSGRMIHDAPTAIAALASALIDGPPRLPASAPAELASLVERACAIDPDARPSNVETFREGLVRFLASRDADALVRDAQMALELAAGAIAKEGPASPLATKALIEARFGLASALRMRPDDPAIRSELDRALRTSIEREIALRSPGAARALLTELQSTPPELARAIEALEAELAAERRDAEAHATSRREADTRAAVRPLTLVIIVWTVIGTGAALFFVPQAWGEGARYPVGGAIATDALAAVITSIGLFLGRRALLATAGTRRLTAYLVVWGWGLILSDAVSYTVGSDVPTAATHSMTVGALVTAAIGVQMPELRPMILVHLLAVVALVLYAPAQPIIVLVALLVNVAIFVRAFRREAARSRAS